MLFKKRRVYMDFASATPLDPSVKSAYVHALSVYGNPSSVHQEGRDAKHILEESRRRIARTLSVRPETLTFTGSGTEGNNLAIKGLVLSLHERGMAFSDMHIIFSGFEHSSVLGPAEWLKREGVAVSFVPPSPDGLVQTDDVRAVVRPETVLVSVCAVQGEIGTIQPLRDIRTALEVVRTKRDQKAYQYAPEAHFPALHTDASQGTLFLDMSPERLGVDMATYDAQKIMGPKGVGVLYKHSSVSLAPIIHGGKQERGIRAGTENVPAIVAMARAFECAHRGREKRTRTVTNLQGYFISRIQKEIPESKVTGSLKKRIANNVHVSFPNVDADYLTVLLDKEGVAVSPRSACIASGELSTLASALELGDVYERGTLRFSLSPHTSKGDIEHVIRALKKVKTLATINKK